MSPRPDRTARFRVHAGIDAEEVLRTLGSTIEGLPESVAAERLEENGPNEIGREKPPSPFVLFLRQLYDPLVGILLFAAVVSLVAQEWTDASVVLGIVLISAVLSFLKEWRASTAVAALTARIAPRATVIRGAEPRSVPSRELVVGDVVELSAGSLVPADSLVLEAKDFLVNEAVLTGETFPVEKRRGTFGAHDPLSRCRSVVFAGTNVRSGRARVLVVSTGSATEYGQVASRLRLRPTETDFERGIRHFGRLVSQVMFALVGIVFVMNVVTEKPPIEALLFAIAIAVGMAPELLPAVLTITLARGAKDMAERGVIVRRLAAIENLGSMDVLCTDKTGTLTEGVVELEGAEDAEGRPSDETLGLAFRNSWLETGFANPLDQAILARARALELELPDVAKVDEIPYDFVRKRLGIVVEEAGKRRLVLKGALAHVLETCDRVRTTSGVVRLDEARRAELVAHGEGKAEAGLRVLGVAAAEVQAKASYDKEDETGLVFEGFLLFSDPPKAGIEKTIADLERLGVTLKIVTGDARAAAIHLATRIGIATEHVLTSKQIADLSDDALTHLAEKTTIFAEVDPNQKERLILALRRTGHCVGYMGDGINDAPALHAADVGISVEGAVDVAKDSADFVLLRRDLGVLHAGIEEGRSTFANTLKYLYTTTSANFGNMLSMAGASAFLAFLPLLAKQVLLNNFLSDFPAMTIASDEVDPELVERPRRWDIREIRSFMLVFGAVSSVFDYLTFFYLRFLMHLSPDAFRTGWFVESLLTELAIVFVVRTHRPLWRSRPAKALTWSSIGVAVLAVALPYSPFRGLFGFVPLAPTVMLSLLALTGTYAFVSELAKYRFFAAHPARRSGGSPR